MSGIEPTACPHCEKPVGGRVTAEELRALVEVMRDFGVTDLASFDTRITMSMGAMQPFRPVAPPAAQVVGLSGGDVSHAQASGGQPTADEKLKPIVPLDLSTDLSDEDEELLFASSGGPPPETAP